MNQAIILELLLATLPYPSQIKNISLDRPQEVRFDWRGERFCVNERLGVDKVEGTLLGSDSTTLLLSDSLKKAAALREARAS